MWPGQQPPGGEQNPQDPNQNPYRQPDYHQDNPYQQANPHQQANPYQQPHAQQYGAPVPPAPPAPPPHPGGPQPPDRNGKKTTVVAIVAASAVVAAGVITGVVVLGKDDKGGSPVAGDKPSPSVSSAPEDTPKEPSAPASAPENPRGGSTEKAKPTIPGWKVVTNPKHGTRFDVPAEWEVEKPGVTISYEDSKNPGKLLIGMSSPAYFKSTWCRDDSDDNGSEEEYKLAAVGSRGANGAGDAGTEAENVAGQWLYAAYDQKQTGTFKISKAKPFTSASGLRGSVAAATVTGVTKKNKCDTDGKSIAFAFKNASGDFAVWNLYTAKGVEGELPDATIRKILGTVRLAGS
ncbi:hypothetical protein [Streptomyces hypolithicus]